MPNLQECWSCGDSLTKCQCDERAMRAIDWSNLDREQPPVKVTPAIPFASCVCGERIYLTRGKRFTDAHVKREGCLCCGSNVLAVLQQESQTKPCLTCFGDGRVPADWARDDCPDAETWCPDCKGEGTQLPTPNRKERHD